MQYDRTVQLEGSFEETAAAVREALAEQGFGVLTEIDVQSTLKAKLDHDMEPYLILGACNPALARQALEADRSIGLLLPCNVVVRTDGEHVIVQAVDPGTMVTLTGIAAMEPVAEEATRRLLAKACERDLTLATAESCTGGMLASLLTDVQGFAHAFDRGLVTYSEESKIDLLGVPADLIADQGAVSKAVATGAHPAAWPPMNRMGRCSMSPRAASSSNPRATRVNIAPLAIGATTTSGERQPSASAISKITSFSTSPNRATERVRLAYARAAGERRAKPSRGDQWTGP